MNYEGSYRRLLANSKSAMVAAIEIYNKPRFEYRDEVFVLLLINSWELLLKAMVSQARKSIFEKKRRNQPYRTLGWSDALERSVTVGAWPTSVPHRAVEENLGLLNVYRDNVVHFYNVTGFGSLIYSLAQTSIVNYRDVLRLVFGQELADEIRWHLMPLGTDPPVDPITFLGKARPGAKTTQAVAQYMKEVRRATSELEAEGIDTTRLLTVFNVSLQSTKKVGKADIVVGVGAKTSDAPIIITRKVDPNLSHPHLLKSIVKQLASSHGGQFTSHTFQAVAWKYSLKEDKSMCWKNETAKTWQWSPEVVAFIKKLSSADLETARAEYAQELRRRRKKAR